MQSLETKSSETEILRDREETWDLRDRDSKKRVSRHVSRPRRSLETPSLGNSKKVVHPWVKWIVVPNFQLEIDYAECCLAEVATNLESTPAEFCICFWSRSQTFVQNRNRSHFFSAGACMVFTNVIASVQNKHCWISVASMAAGYWRGVRF